MIGIRAARRGTIARPVLAPLAAGVRASAGKVGYLGSQAALTVLNIGDPLPGGWSAAWDTGTLVVSGDNVTVDHYRINASVVFDGDNPTMTHCEIHCNPTDVFGVTINGIGHGVLTITDTTVIGDGSGINPQVNGISSDSGLVARRCDVSGTGDGIHMVAQSSSTDAIISQCYIHDQSFVEESQHCDGIQVFEGVVESFLTVEHTYIARTISTLGTPMNAAMTCGAAANDSTPLSTPVVNNSYFESGLYHLRIGFRVQNTTVTNNDFGPLHASEFGTVAVSVPSAIVNWSDNRDSDGNLIPNPYVPTTPVIKEVLQTTDGLTSSQVLSTTAGLTASGDTLLIVYATDNNTAAAPTSTAGTLTQIGTTETNGDGNGLLRVYQVPIGSDGSKDITMPAAGGFDVMGSVLLIDGAATNEGFVKANFPSAAATFNTPSASLAGSVDLLVSAMFNTQGRTFDLSASGLTQRSNPKCLPFAALCVGTDVLSSAGASPSYTVNLDDQAKSGVVVFGLRML